MSNFNYDYFKQYKYESDSKGNICCPVCGTKETFNIDVNINTGLNRDQEKLIWTHVQTKHLIEFNQIYDQLVKNSSYVVRESLTDQLMTAAADTNKKINTTIHLYLLNTLTKDQALASIKEHNEDFQLLLQNLL
ncbi:hypothetical protein I4U23_027787 [Adineta vaga]|nr:hypothetical protein I4U23_027787 [Adineta vaga]